MRKVCFTLSATCVFFSLVGNALAGDVYVSGYFRKDGTYVEPYVRSSPDQYKYNNYGPSENDFERLNPTYRDSDNDGVANYIDQDDNNNSILDDQDQNQYYQEE